MLAPIIFFVGIINVWNRLTDKMVNDSSFSTFNYKLINADLPFVLLVNLSTTLIILNVLLILLTFVTKLCRYFNRFIRILSYRPNVTF